MAKLSPEAIFALCRQNGFTRSQAIIGTCIALAESSGDTSARNTNSDSHHSVDRGLWQINNYWHPEVTDACADDPVCATKAAYRISNQGTSWSQWSTWPRVQATIQSGKLPFTPPPDSATTTTTTTGGDPAGTKLANQLVSLLKSQVGVPYLWGGESPGKGFDCSGLVQWAYGRIGISLPRTTQEQVKAGKHVDLADIRVGDCIFFSESGSVGHVAIYLGGGQAIHAPHTGLKVVILPLTHFTTGYLPIADVRRFLANPPATTDPGGGGTPTTAPADTTVSGTATGQVTDSNWSIAADAIGKGAALASPITGLPYFAYEAITGPVSGVLDFFKALTSGKLWVRIGMVIGGMLLLYIVWILFIKQETGSAPGSGGGGGVAVGGSEGKPEIPEIPVE